MNEMSTKSVPAARSHLWLQVVAGALCGAGLTLGLGRYIISDPGIPEPAAPPVNLTRPSLPQSADPYANLTRPSLPEPEPEQPRSSVSGRIYDPANNPVADAWVCSRHNGDIDHCTKSNSDGDYQLDDLPRDTAWISTSAATFEPSRWEIELTPGQLTKHVDIQLQAGGLGLSGVVQDIYRNSIAGARISTSNAATFSDRQGRFKLWLEPDAVQVTAIADGHVETTMQSDASDGPHELFLLPESVIVGKVVDVRTGGPIEGASVSVHAEHSVSYGSARTDETGRFRIHRLTPGDYQLSATAYRAQGHSAELVHLGLAETSDEIVIQAHPAAYVTSRVQIADTGRPCASGYVSLHRQRAEHEVHEFDGGALDDRGRLEFWGLLPGIYDVGITCFEYRRYESYPPLVVGARDIGGIEWTVPAIRVPPQEDNDQPDTGTSKIRGRVVDEAGAPVSRLEVHPLYDKQAWVPSGMTDADGWFEIENLPSGKLKLVASDRTRPDDGQYMRTLEGNEFEAIADRTVETVLVVESRRGRIVGVLYDEHGDPVANALVVALEHWLLGISLVAWDKIGEPVTTDESGRFVLEGLAEREYLVHAYRRGGGEAIAISDQFGGELELTITQGSALAGTVTREDGSTPRSFYITAKNQSLGFQMNDDFLLTNGIWRLDHLPAGRYELSVGLDQPLAQVVVDVEEDEVLEGIELRVPVP
jgi:hypothetical protein